MRTLALAVLLALAVPASAQRAADVPGRPAPAAVSAAPGALGLGQLFTAETLDFSQSFEASYGGGAGGALGLGVYTATLRWQPSQRLAGRVDVGVMQGLAGSPALMDAYGLDNGPRVFLRNAELAYRPTETSMIHLSIQQSPYGSYASPYGYGRYGTRGLGLGYGTASSGRDLFFRDAPSD